MGDKGKVQLIPKDGQVMLAIIKEMGMSEYDPRTVVQLTDFVYKYVSTVFEESRILFNNTNKKFLDVEDIQAGLHLMAERVLVPVPPQEISSETVSAINNMPLPPVKPHDGLRLPQQGTTLTNSNYILTKPTVKKFNTVARPGLSVNKSQHTYVKRISTASHAVAHQQSVIVPSAKINVVPKFKVNAEPQLINGTLKRTREDE